MKRFTETEKWRDPWFQGLSTGSKLLFLYLIDNCNNAGFYEENIREICFQLGIGDEQYKGALKGLERGIEAVSGWLWVKRFLRHQKNDPLNPQNPAHRQIIHLIEAQLTRFSKSMEFQIFKAPYKGLLRPIGTGKGTGKKKRETEGEKKSHDLIYDAYPRKVGKPNALMAIRGALRVIDAKTLLARTQAYALAVTECDKEFIPYPSTWFNQQRFNDDPETWVQSQTNGEKPAKPKEHVKWVSAPRQ